MDEGLCHAVSRILDGGLRIKMSAGGINKDFAGVTLISTPVDAKDYDSIKVISFVSEDGGKVAFVPILALLVKLGFPASPDFEIVD